MNAVRTPVLAGSWYPASPADLGAEVAGYLAGADPSRRPAGRALIALAPHAGYTYSGPVAGRTLGLLAGDPPDRIVILAPNHRVAIDRLALSGAGAYATPLGEVPVDTAARDRLADLAPFAVDDRAHAHEHAIEIQLPFLQSLWPDHDFSILPLLVTRLAPDLRAEATAALAELRDDRTLLLVSTDFTHFGADYGYLPFREDIPASLEKLDTGAILRVLGADAEGLREYGDRTGITMCGLEAAALALETGLPGGYEAALIDYARSADRDGDFSRSVSYAGVLVCTGS